MKDKSYLNDSMFKHFKLWESSGMTIAEYAKSIGVSRSGMYYWIRKFRTQTKDTPSHSKNLSSLKFIELSDFSEYSTSSSKISNNKSQREENHNPQEKLIPKISISLPSGVCLNIY